MKKIITFAACAMLAAATNAAAVGWQLAGGQNYAGDAYQFFVIGQKNVESIATVTALLDAGSSTDAYAFGSGKVAANGNATVAATAAGQPTLSAGTYTGFYVVFDSASPTSGTTKYTVVSGASGLTKEVSASAASITFQALNQSTYLNNADNWKSYGPVPEPTSGLLLLLGMAGLALKRKRA